MTGRSLSVDDGLVVVGRFLWVDCCGSVAVDLAMSQLLWVGRCELIAVGQFSRSRLVATCLLRDYLCVSPPSICPVHLYMCLLCACGFHILNQPS